MRILGIDPGLKATGYGFIDYEKPVLKLVDVGEIHPKVSDKIEKRLQKVYTVLDKLIDQYQPNVLVLEKIYTHYKHPATAGILGHMRGVICLLSAQKNVLLIEESVKRIRKSITGNGNSDKNQIQRFLLQLFSIPDVKLTLDASDALALAVGYAYLEGRVSIDSIVKKGRL